LTAESISREVEPLCIGVFAAGRDAKGRFLIRKVGRSDRDLAAELKELAGQYDVFKYLTYGSTRRAYAKECQLFHDFAPADSKEHPKRPKGTRFSCPVASCPEAE
jgi:hypothetical protein